MTIAVPHQDVPSEVEPGSLDELVADAAEVTRHLAEVPPQVHHYLSIPEQAVGVVAELDTYGD